MVLDLICRYPACILVYFSIHIHTLQVVMLCDLCYSIKQSVSMLACDQAGRRGWWGPWREDPYRHWFTRSWKRISCPCGLSRGRPWAHRRWPPGLRSAGRRCGRLFCTCSRRGWWRWSPSGRRSYRRST